MPDGFDLLQNFPNPFNPETTIQYHLDQPGQVTLCVYDVLGKEIIQLVNKIESVGMHQVQWYGRDSNQRQMSSGVYFSRLTGKTNAGQEVHKLNKMIMIK